MVCGSGTGCLYVAQFDVHTCVSKAQEDACMGAADATACDLDGAPGTCFDGACHPATCGDKIVDLTEVCDDANRVSGDLCSSNCMSREVCGDGVVDFAQQEQCDDGSRGLAGDGCSSSCKGEFAIWRDPVLPTPPERSEFRTATGLDGSLAMYGGVGMASGTAGMTTSFSDLWTFDGASWLPSVTTGPTPPPRTEFAFAHDPTRKRLIVFGGLANDGTTSLGDLWEWDGLRWTDRTPTSGPKPSARYGASLACTNERCVLFGGATSVTTASDQNDLWQWSGTSWSPLTISGSPLPRRGATWIADPGRHVFELVGGTSGVPPATVPRIDAWELDLFETDPTPDRWLQVIGTFPQGKSYGTYDVAQQKPILVTGTTTYVYTAANFAWTQQLTATAPQLLEGLAYSPLAGAVLGLASKPIATYKYSNAGGWTQSAPFTPSGGGAAGRIVAAYDARRARAIIVDNVATPNLAATWEWNGVGWRRTLRSGPTPGDGAAIAYDSICGKAVYYGGQTTGFLGAVWSHDGGAWLPAAATVPRAWHAMTFDVERGALVVFGGRTASGFDATTYEQRGTCDARTWMNANPALSPPARSNAALTYDEHRKVSVLFGGTNGTTDLGDTWVWNGSEWKQRTPMKSPSPRSDHVMAYDPRRQRVVLFGGRSAGFLMSDVWEWDDEHLTWVEVPPIVTTPGRAGGAMVRDPISGLLLIGGTAAPASSRLRYERGLEPIERCVLATDDFDKDGLAGCDDPDCWGRCAPSCPSTTPVGTCSARCGDGVCNPTEDDLLCPGDCPVPP